MARAIRPGIRAFCGAAALAMAGAAFGGDAAAPQDTTTVLRSELKELLTRLAASGALDGGTTDALAVSAPPVRVVTLGAVLDTSGNGRELNQPAPIGEVSRDRRNTLAIRWIVTNARARSEKTMEDRLVGELLDSANGRGGAMKKKDDVHRMAEANKAFAHYRF